MAPCQYLACPHTVAHRVYLAVLDSSCLSDTQSYLLVVVFCHGTCHCGKCLLLCLGAFLLHWTEPSEGRDWVCLGHFCVPCVQPGASHTVRTQHIVAGQIK